MSNEFSLEEKFESSDKLSDRMETYATPRNEKRSKGFEVYRETAGKLGEGEEYQGIVEKLKYEMGDR